MVLDILRKNYERLFEIIARYCCCVLCGIVLVNSDEYLLRVTRSDSDGHCSVSACIRRKTKRNSQAKSGAVISRHKFPQDLI